jgi:MFS family permease
MSSEGMRDMWPHVHPAMRGLRIAGFVVMGVIGAALFALVFGWLVMILWNWLMPAIFSLGVITYWQAFGIVILAKLIFGAAGGNRHGGPRHNPWKGNPWGGPRGSARDNWRFYRDFWEEEGRHAFDQYLERKKAAEEGPGSREPGPGA